MSRLVLSVSDTLPRAGGGWTEACGQQKQSNDPGNNQHNPQYANYWAPLMHKRHIPPHPAQPRHTNRRAPRTRKRHQQEHRPQRPTERSDPTQHAKGRTGDCPGPRRETTTRLHVTQGGGGWIKGFFQWFFGGIDPLFWGAGPQALGLRGIESCGIESTQRGGPDARPPAFNSEWSRCECEVSEGT